TDRLAVASRLRVSARVTALDPDLPVSELVNALLTQVTLRERGRAKFGDRAASMFFTPSGLEQSTRSTVAAYRAERTTQASATAPRDDTAAVHVCLRGAALLALADGAVPREGVSIYQQWMAVARDKLDALRLDACAWAWEDDVANVSPGAHRVLFSDPS